MRVSFCGFFCYLCFLACLCYAVLSVRAALWSPAGKGLASWLSCVMFSCIFVIFPYGVPGQVWYLIVLIPDL